MEKHLKALEIENVINKFAGTNNNLVSTDELLREFKISLAEGLRGLQWRGLITEKEEIELNNICFNCNDDFEKAFADIDGLEAINVLINRLKELSIEFMEAADNEI